MKKLMTAVALMVVSACATVSNKPMLDLKITNGRIVDGTGAPWYRSDTGVRGNTIVSIGDLANTPATATIDAHDQIVSPGFIDLLGQSDTAVLVDPHLEAKVRQGVTTEVTGEGFSPGPSKPREDSPRPRFLTLREYLDTIDRQGVAINFALLIGASNPREMVIGDVNRPPTMAEMREMEAIVDQAMRDGAIGLSTSLIYLPAMYSTTDEIINLSKVAARYGGMY
ncbi:MAG TPA: D-aminoacylase, partial [Thermoanaerobaculia bacterium]|nr:D-aminoacylase [Thermoanaerobaculia bacterium]